VIAGFNQSELVLEVESTLRGVSDHTELQDPIVAPDFPSAPLTGAQPADQM
jgi:hypothetical protein